MGFNTREKPSTAGHAPRPHVASRHHTGARDQSHSIAPLRSATALLPPLSPQGRRQRDRGKLGSTPDTTGPAQLSAAQSLRRADSATPRTAAPQASLCIANSRSSLKLMSIELVMPSSHLILCHPLLLPPSIFPSIRVFSKESVLLNRQPKY